MYVWFRSASRQYQRLGRRYASDLTVRKFAVTSPGAKGHTSLLSLSAKRCAVFLANRVCGCQRATLRRNRLAQRFRPS